ncbi:MAG: fimbrillin family protein, partial [Paramuribaculum sp.]|nr:fimbrillin family protein [Paramuribaculum sp.]
FAYTDASVIMNGVTVSREGGSWTYSPLVYWPASPVDFYAVSPDIRNGREMFSGGAEVIHGVEYGSTDLLYAVALGEIERPAPVPLTFRHAMSQVSILLSSTSNKYTVEVYHVSVNNIALSGDFTYPQQNTSEDGATGSWSNLSASASALLYYDVDGNPALLTTTPRNLTEGNLESSFFVPQNLETLKYAGTSGFVGSYMQIDCIIKDKATGEKIWPNEYTPKYLLVQATECGRMLFPLSTPDVTSWQQGYSYVYNVVIDHTYSIDTIEFAPVVKDYIESNPY